MYFVITTLTTVGFGDTTPQNLAEAHNRAPRTSLTKRG